MQILEGLAIAGGLAIGPLWFLPEGKATGCPVAGTPEEEKARFLAASETAVDQLTADYEKTLAISGEQDAAIFDIHRMLVEDEDFADAVLANIDDGMEAAQATRAAGDECAAVFEAIEDEYTRERAGDFRDIAQRIAGILDGIETSCPAVPAVICAGELTPSQTVQFPRNIILGFVTRLGSLNSHAGILARNFGIPAVSGIELPESAAGSTVVIDGTGGRVILDPDEATLKEMTAKLERQQELRRLQQELRDLPTVTRDGRKVRLCGNIGDTRDLDLLQENGAEGVGLFRSEFLYLSRTDYPSEEELFRAYKLSAEALGDRPLIIRTLDIGADKQADYFRMEKEENPALGLRAIRLCLTRPELFRTQLRAILRATPYGHIGIMFPMVISVEEVHRLKEALAQAEASLKAEGIPVGKYETGIMIETPAAVWMTDELAKEVDFFSIGTNDLTQYTLAIDRQNPNLNPFFDPHHPAVLRSIRRTVENGHAGGAWVGICGELGGDPELIEWFLNIGVDELSVSPAKILPLRDRIRKL